MPRGFFSIASITDSTGKVVSRTDAERYGWVRRSTRYPRFVGLGPDEIPLGENLFVDGGRQYALYAFSFKSPISNYTIQQFSVGTGTTPPTMGDVQLENAVTLSSGSALKQIDGVGFPAPFVARVDFTLGLNDANGYLLTEFGIFSGDGVLLARFTRVGLNKTSDWSPTIAYRLRF